MVKDSFIGNVQWHAEQVKLDLKARGIIKRTKEKIPKYILSNVTK
jgi:hypothetical protein